MKDVRLTIKNYRCFDDNNPLVVDLGRNFTALVGPNNSGKSSFLKFFYEFRNLWQALWQQLPTLVQTNQYGVNLNEIPDYEEVFSNTNERDLVIEIQMLTSSTNTSTAPQITRAICTCSRRNPGYWNFQFFTNRNTKPLNKSTTASWSETYVSVTGGDGVNFSVADFIDVMKCFQQALYIGPFRNAINEGAGSYYDMAIGSSFIDTWHTWKTGVSKAQNRAIESVTSDIRNIFDYGRLEINASREQKTLSVYVNGNPYRLQELGAGLSQFIIVLGNAAIKKPPLILIDEPELHLHPSLQIDFLTSLGSYAQDGVIFATHSIGLARSTADRLYSFQNKNGHSTAKPFEQTLNYVEFVGELSFSVFKEMGHDRILLVEGVHDIKTVHQFLRMQKKDHRIVVISLGGDQLARGGVETELAELLRLSNNVSALVDSERVSENAAPKIERRDFQEICEKLSIKICVTERRAIENYFTDKAVKEALGDSHSALASYELLKDSKNGWRKSDNWKIARCMTFDDIAKTDVGQFIANL